MKGLYISTVLAWSAILPAATVSAQEEPDSQTIIEALVPKPADNGTTPKPGVRGLRGLEVSEPKADPAKPPSIDIRVTFAFDSAQLDDNATITLRRLGTALSDPRLANYTFMIGGHTDAKGTDEYNQDLSERRAQSIVSYLVSQMNVDERRLVARGYGESQLFDAANPEDGINRRVQIVNLGETQ
ncbi:OmpA family protein [Mesorhizobium sp. M0991]|uniref:OmpA family protein n=1 Tax=Mesorhizobium sp. M0991 TaxID=2957043 RepID=UPI0033354183